VIVNVKLKARKYTSKISAFMVRFPDESLHQLSEAVCRFTKTVNDPKLAMHVFIMDVEYRSLRGEAAKPGLAGLIYDAHGEEHALSESGFKWALDIPGTIILSPTTEITLRQVNALQGKPTASWVFRSGTADRIIENTKAALGMHSHLSAATTSRIEPDTLIKGWKWWEKVEAIDTNLGGGSFVLLEIMQKVENSSDP
jgi:hypothetical protein